MDFWVKYSLLLIIILLISCNNSSQLIYKDQLILEDGYYFINHKNKDINILVSGKVVSCYPSGKTSSIFLMNKGVPEGSAIHYGYQNEILGKDQYFPIINTNQELKQYGVIRLNFVTSSESNNIHYYVMVILKEKFPILEQVQDELLKIVYNLPQVQQLKINSLTLQLCFGEFEPIIESVNITIPN